MKLPRETTDKYVVEAVLKALDVLESFRDSEELQLSEISKRVALNKSRAFRLLHTLCERGYVERGSDGHRYRLGLKLFEHASSLRRDVKHAFFGFLREVGLQSVKDRFPAVGYRRKKSFAILIASIIADHEVSDAYFLLPGTRNKSSPRLRSGPRRSLVHCIVSLLLTGLPGPKRSR